MVQASDELNLISIPYERYFGEMGLTEEEKELRIALAEALDDVFMLMFLLISADFEVKNSFDADYYTEFATRYYESVLSDFDIDIYDKYPYLQTHIRQTAKEVVGQIVKKPDDVWNLSDDRAKLIAENEANSVREYTEFQDAVDSGKTMKTWNTMLDRKVRHTHAELESLTIPIMETFKVGDSEMYQPKDTSLGASMEEIANCRCWCTYT